MNPIKPLAESPESVTLSRADFDALREELEDRGDLIIALQDELLDMKPDGDRYMLTMDETMRIIDGENPIKVWREKRGMTTTELADALGLHDVDLLAMEKRGATVDPRMLSKISGRLGVFSDQLVPPEVAS
jgi:DNA-binding XRE family transcriptional regulator